VKKTQAQQALERASEFCKDGKATVFQRPDLQLTFQAAFGALESIIEYLKIKEESAK